MQKVQSFPHEEKVLINIFCCISEPKITNRFPPFRQIEVTRSLLDTYPYLDRSRVGIWGWSYGGYSTLRILQRDEEEVFACGAIVAPPTNWLFYDSVYTERYMALPTEGDNQAGYDRGSVLAEEEVGWHEVCNTICCKHISNLYLH